MMEKIYFRIQGALKPRNLLKKRVKISLQKIVKSDIISCYKNVIIFFKHSQKLFVDLFLFANNWTF